MTAPISPALLDCEANCNWWADRAEKWQEHEHFWLDMAMSDHVSEAKADEYRLQARIAANYVTQAELKCMQHAAELEVS